MLSVFYCEIKYWLVWFESLLVFILFKFKKTSQHFRNSGFTCSCASLPYGFYFIVPCLQFFLMFLTLNLTKAEVPGCLLLDHLGTLQLKLFQLHLVKQFCHPAVWTQLQLPEPGQKHKYKCICIHSFCILSIMKTVKAFHSWSYSVIQSQLCCLIVYSLMNIAS